MNVIVKRDPTVKYADQTSPQYFYLLKDKNSGKDYFLIETSNGDWEWSDFGSRENLSSFESFQDAIDFATSNNNFTLVEHTSRIGFLTTLQRNTQEAVNKRNNPFLG